jgi:hypothetical protein
MTVQETKKTFIKLHGFKKDHRHDPAFLRKQFISWRNQLLQESTSHVMHAQSFLGLPAYKRHPQVSNYSHRTL